MASKKIIQQLLSVRGLKVECPNCRDTFSIKKAKLFNMHDEYPIAGLNILQRRLEDAKQKIDEISRRAEQLEINKSKPEKLAVTTESVNFGNICEHVIPAFLNFPYKQQECRTLFEPIDYLVFPGLSNCGRVEMIKFVEFKTGGSRLKQNQTQIRDCVLDGNVKHTVIG